MSLIQSNGNGRVIDELHRALSKHSSLDAASPALSLFAFSGLRLLLNQLTTESLGLAPGSQFSFIQCPEKPEKWALLSAWFSTLWNGLQGSTESKAALLAGLQDLVAAKPPSLIHHLTLYHLLRERGDELDEDKKARATNFVFRDSAFADEVAKTNLAAILQQHGLQNIRSL